MLLGILSGLSDCVLVCRFGIGTHFSFFLGPESSLGLSPIVADYFRVLVFSLHVCFINDKIYINSMTDNILASEYMYSEYIAKLSQLEKEVIREFASKGVLCGYDFHLGGKRTRGTRKALMSSSNWEDVKKKLGPEGFELIHDVQISGRPRKGFARRKEPKWLTSPGVFLAYMLDYAGPQGLLESSKRFLPAERYTHLLLELACVLPKRVIVNSLLLMTEDEEPNIDRFVASVVNMRKKGMKMEPDKLRQVREIIRKYPEYSTQYRDTVKEISRVAKLMEESL